MTDLAAFLTERITEEAVECEAKRRIMQLCNGSPGGSPGEFVLADLVMEALAAPYRDHPDFDPAWLS